MIKLVYDCQTFTEQKYGGISRLFTQLLMKISESPDFSVSVYAGLYQNMYLSEQSKSLVKGHKINYPPKTLKLIRGLNTTYCRAMCSINHPDIVHETYYSKRKTSFRSAKTVLTVFDMIHEKFLNQQRDKELSRTKLEAIKRADHVICISENTRKDLIEITGLQAEKTSVIYLGHSHSVNSTEKEPLIKYPYILYVGLRVPEYKNFKRLLQGYASSKILKDNLKLVCFGPNSFSRAENELIESFGLNSSSVIYLSGDDSILKNLYSNAIAFVYPSLYEGFGIPPLEAMFYDCPVVCSNTSSIPEVVGNAGEYFNPYDSESIASSIEKVVVEREYRQKLVSNGKQNLSKFTWDKCARETMLIYKKIAENI